MYMYMYMYVYEVKSFGQSYMYSTCTVYTGTYMYMDMHVYICAVCVGHVMPTLLNNTAGLMFGTCIACCTSDCPMLTMYKIFLSRHFLIIEKCVYTYMYMYIHVHVECRAVNVHIYSIYIHGCC